MKRAIFNDFDFDLRILRKKVQEFFLINSASSKMKRLSEMSTLEFWERKDSSKPRLYQV